MNIFIIFEANFEKTILEVIMKYLKKALFVIAMMALAVGNLNAQYVTTHAKIVLPGQQNGIYYALPRTVVRLDFIIEETELLEGPYSEYVRMVGADDYVIGNDMEYRLVDIKMTTYAEADPNAMFFVTMNPKKGDVSEFALTSKGILQGVNVKSHATVEEPKDINLPEVVSTPDRTFKFQYGSNGAKGKEQMARSAADMISRMREEKVKLLTGFQETAFSLETYRQMYADLDEMEKEYLSLFIGKRITKTTVKTIYVTPTKDVPTQTIGKFSESKGFTAGVSGEGSPITVQAISLNTTGNINEPSQSAVETLSHENKLFYRIPETANIRVNMDGEVLLERRTTITQLGVFMLAPLGKTKLALDPNTGQITSFGME
jgi:hypothetical protein